MDAAAFRTETMKQQRLLWRVSWAMLGSQEDCAGAVREAVARAWRQHGTLRGRRALRSLLVRTLADVCGDRLRDRERKAAVEEAGPAAADGDALCGFTQAAALTWDDIPAEAFPPLPDSEAGLPDVSADDTPLREALERLSPEQRTPTVLRYLEGYSVREIARMTGTPNPVVKSRLVYARMRLQSLLGSQWYA